MLILPALDLLDGRVVRLRQGRFDRVTPYSDDPVATARRWISAGAAALHIVDLNGARSGRPTSLEWIYRIRAGFPDTVVHVGGGIRTFALASRLLDSEVDRIVLGTAAVREWPLVRKLAGSFDTDRIVVGLDARDGTLRVDGWESEAGRPIDEVLDDMSGLGIEWAACTDVAKDGTLRGPGLELAARLIERRLRVIVAGGIRSASDVEVVREMGAAGCIIGSALYEGVLSLPDAIAAAGQGSGGRPC